MNDDINLHVIHHIYFTNHRQKTVKSTAELEVELNATYAFDAITESGAKLVPVAGPGKYSYICILLNPQHAELA